MAWLGVVAVLVWLSLVQGQTGGEDLKNLLIGNTDEHHPQILSRQREELSHPVGRTPGREEGVPKQDLYYTNVRWTNKEDSPIPISRLHHRSDVERENQRSHEQLRSKVVKKNSDIASRLRWSPEDEKLNYNPRLRSDENYPEVEESHHWSLGGGRDHHNKHGYRLEKKFEPEHHHNPLHRSDDIDPEVAASHHWSHGDGGDHHSDHHNKHGHKAYKGYESKHHNDHGKKGHHDKEGSSGHHEEHGGHKKKHHDNGGYHKEHHKGEKGHKRHKYHDKGSYKKGHSTKGKHVIHKLDEYKKNKHFHDEDYDEGHHKKHGGYHHHHDHHHGGEYKKGHKESNYHDDHKGKKGHHKKGGHFKEHKGHKNAGGHDEHYGHKSDYGKKNGHKDHKRWKWSEKY